MVSDKLGAIHNARRVPESRRPFDDLKECFMPDSWALGAARMTVEILGPDGTSEHSNAERLKSALINSAPELAHPELRMAIVPQVFAKNREIDCVLIFEDTRAPENMFRTSQGVSVHSFVACVEVKGHSPDAVRRHGSHLEVQYDGKWHDATAQAEAQVWALREHVRVLQDVQKFAYHGKARRSKTYVQSVLWLSRVPAGALIGALPNERTGILHADLNWQRLIDGFGAVFVKGVVRRFHAAFLISGALFSVSGLSQTGPAGCQLRVLPDQRFGFWARAFA